MPPKVKASGGIHCGGNLIVSIDQFIVAVLYSNLLDIILKIE